MFRSLGPAEIIVIVLILLLLFGGKWLGRAGRVAGESAKKTVLGVKWFWTRSTGTDQEGLSAERDFGQAWAEEIRRQHGDKVPDEKQAALDQLGAQLQRARETPWPFSFRLIASGQMNAFALPGGFVFVFERLFDAFRADRNAMAFILAHEMAHVLLGHGYERLKREFLLKGAESRAAGAGKLLKTLVAEGYSRNDELEADKEAVALLRASGFDGAGATRVLALFGRMAETEPGFAEYLSSHPTMEERLRNLRA